MVSAQASVRSSRAVTRVVSVCTLRDLSTFAVAAAHILRHISAADYWVVVPDMEVDEFRAVLPSSYQVMPESRILPGGRAALQQRMPAESLARMGWYYQQFIKLAVMHAALPEETVLIWDADTVPLRPLRFADARGRLLFYRGSEYHRPYFRAINQLLSLEKVVDYSFVAQCFPVKGRWAAEFFEEIEARHKKWWLDAILDIIDFQEESGFSEYETIGTFLSHHHGGEIVLVRRHWVRLGNTLIGGIQNLRHPLARLVLARCDFASFESWDRPFGRFPPFLRSFLARIFGAG